VPRLASTPAPTFKVDYVVAARRLDPGTPPRPPTLRVAGLAVDQRVLGRVGAEGASPVAVADLFALTAIADISP
jgi:hypothetical protein